jgi:hypothetical protein
MGTNNVIQNIDDSTNATYPACFTGKYSFIMFIHFVH